MDFVPPNKVLEFKPDTLQYVRKLYNLDQPGTLKQAVFILNEWIQQQSHFNKKNFDRHYLEITIIMCKGSIERAKRQLDRICTIRTLLPNFFGTYNPKTDFEHLYKVAQSFMLPKLTEDHYRVHVTKYFDVEWKASQIIHYYRHNVILAEYLKAHDYCVGSIMVIDFLDANLMSFLKKLNFIEYRQSMTLFIEGYGMRLKSIHIITKPKVVDGLVSLLKQVLSAKLASRINVHQSYDELHTFIPKYILPKDYGGEERSLKTLQEEWINLLSSEENLNYLQEMNAATTNESCRQKEKFCEQYAGMPGTFRYLSVD